MTEDRTRAYYVCEACHGTFAEDQRWTETDARAEAADAFPGVPIADMAKICGVCYKAIMEWYEEMKES